LNLAFLEGKSAEIFTPGAIEAIYAYSKGIPRLINLTCDSALLSGYVDNTFQITENIINEVIKERDFESIREEIKDLDLSALEKEKIKILSFLALQGAERQSNILQYKETHGKDH